ncbi:NAD(P)-binding domain-containing protein [Streptomyces sp. MB09-01]|uniref:NADPH-dependent F420 reductase n=1 Tax=Streptomyces sp. MB09-01 TaxID=3028666 RepID=UPI0029B73048|nr:NAD(P)-binding domain-containing protein [Streptomyces sp. MB09-01]MDX3535696.1 NAD(P)-binding domain-containing protein [Streptomyces sp. MB09-01]
MRIGILGAGAMAEALGAGWAKAGHDIVVAARDADKATDLAARLGARAGTFAEAAAHGDAVLAALPHTAMLDVVAPLADALAGRAVIDCSNPIVPGPGGLMLTTDGGPSAARRIADAAPDAHVIKAFNVCAAEVWARYPDGLAVPLCGDDAGALDLVRALVTDLGAIPLDAGGLDRAGYVEATAAFVIGVWFAGGDPRTVLPLVEHARG